MLGFELELEWLERTENQKCDCHWEECTGCARNLSFYQAAVAESALSSWALSYGEDGSLADGVEFRSSVRSWVQWQATRDTLATWFELARTECETDTTCGTHVHVCRSDFTNAEHLRRFIHFLWSDTGRLRAVSERSRNEGYGVAHPASQEQLDAFEQNARVLGGGDAVRLNFGGMTVECRFWSGTDTVDGLYARLGGTHAMLEYTRNELAPTWPGLLAWVEDRGSEYAEFLTLLQRVWCAHNRV